MKNKNNGRGASAPLPQTFNPSASLEARSPSATARGSAPVPANQKPLPKEEFGRLVLDIAKRFPISNGGHSGRINWKAAFDGDPTLAGRFGITDQKSMARFYHAAAQVLKTAGLKVSQKRRHAARPSSARAKSAQSGTAMRAIEINHVLGAAKPGLVSHSIFVALQQMTATMFRATLEMQNQLVELNQSVILAGRLAHECDQSGS